MVEKRKFAALAELSRRPADQDGVLIDEEFTPVLQVAVQEAGQGRGRPATGKRSNPDWKLFSHFLKKKTQREAMARLLAADDGKDLSDVLQGLLENWLKSYTNAD